MPKVHSPVFDEQQCQQCGSSAVGALLLRCCYHKQWVEAAEMREVTRPGGNRAQVQLDGVSNARQK